jgi:hypothetical protein
MNIPPNLSGAGKLRFKRYGDLSADTRRLLFPAAVCLPILLIAGLYALTISFPAAIRLSRD